jgi:hypothetical protein
MDRSDHSVEDLSGRGDPGFTPSSTSAARNQLPRAPQYWRLCEASPRRSRAVCSRVGHIALMEEIKILRVATAPCEGQGTNRIWTGHQWPGPLG